eukprot:gene10132-11990_t
MSYQQVGTSDSYEDWCAPNIEETKQVKPIEVRATIEAWYPPVKDPPIILKDVDVTFEPGTMTALMGASGAGKTSLLNVLSGKALGTLVGEILLNNAPVNYGNIKNVCNFVPQDDLMYDSLTVSEALMYYAQLRVLKDSFELPATESYRQELVSNLIIRLGLDYVKDVKIGNVLQPGKTLLLFKFQNNPHQSSRRKENITINQVCFADYLVSFDEESVTIAFNRDV